MVDTSTPEGEVGLAARGPVAGGVAGSQRQRGWAEAVFPVYGAAPPPGDSQG